MVISEVVAPETKRCGSRLGPSLALRLAAQKLSPIFTGLNTKSAAPNSCACAPQPGTAAPCKFSPFSPPLLAHPPA